MNEPVCRHKVIMVIDDNPIEHFILENFFHAEQFAEKILRYEKAKDALTFLAQHATSLQVLPSLIFLDINMPFMDGFEFIKAFNALDDTVRNKCKIVMVSSSIYEEDLERVNNCPHVSLFIDKPLTREKLASL